MGLTRPNSSLFSTPGFVVSPVGKRERGEERKEKKKPTTKMGRREKGNRKGEKEGRREEGIKKDQRQDKKIIAPLCWVFCLCPRELVGPAGGASVR